MAPNASHKTISKTHVSIYLIHPIEKPSRDDLSNSANLTKQKF